MYKNEEEMPKEAPKGSMPEMLGGMYAFKGDASDQAYGQAGKSGCMSDNNKIKSQMNHDSYMSDGY